MANGESRSGPPLTIMGSPFVASKVLPGDTAGGHLLVALDTPPGRGPEMHVHLGQSEWFYVVGGRIGLECDGARLVLAKGDSYLVPAGASHAYVVLGADTAHLLNLFDPGGSMLAFFGEYAAVLNRPGPPDLTVLKQIYEAHGMKVVGPPLSVAAFS